MFRQNKFDDQLSVKVTSSDVSRYNTTSTLTYANTPWSSPARPGFKRYSLADTLFSVSPKPRHGKHNNSSPEASKSYNSKLSTLIDSNSPGYSSRVVQYHEEQEKSFCHPKYGGVGIFPIVHFFKRDLPYLKRKSDHVNVHMNSSELSKYNSSEHNRLLLERIIRSGSGNTTPHKNEVNTKSVLDALKEISRKRIHSNEDEFILKEDGKRILGNYESGSNSRKRLKQNTLQGEDSNSSKSLSNRHSPINELMASYSSMNGQIIEQSKVKRTIATASTQVKHTTSTNLVDVETQTTIYPAPVITKSVETAREEEKQEEGSKYQQKKKTRKASPVKIFDETPLETMRKNRLRALMGSLDNETNKNEEPVTKVNGADKTVLEKPLVSILSGPVKSPEKIRKHVTFNIADTFQSDVVKDYQSSTSLAVSEPGNGLLHTRNDGNVTQTSTAVITPIVSSSIVESSSNKSVLEMTANQKFSGLFSLGDSTIKCDTQVEPTTTVVSSVFPTLNSFGSNTLITSSPTLKIPNLNAPIIEPSNNIVKLGEIKNDVSAIATAKSDIIFKAGDVKASNDSNSGITSSNNYFGDKSNLGISVDISKSSIETSTQKPGFKFELKASTTTSEQALKPSNLSGNMTSSKLNFFENNQKFAQIMKPNENTQHLAFCHSSKAELVKPSEFIERLPFSGTKVDPVVKPVTNTQHSAFSVGSSALSQTTSVVPNMNQNASALISPLTLTPQASIASAPSFFGAKSQSGLPTANFGTSGASSGSSFNFKPSNSMPTNFISDTNKVPISFGSNVNNVPQTVTPTFNPTYGGIFGTNTKPTSSVNTTTSTTTSLFFQPSSSSTTQAPTPSGVSFGDTAFNKPGGDFNKPSIFNGSNPTLPNIFSGSPAQNPTNNTPSFGVQNTTFNGGTSVLGNNLPLSNFASGGVAKPPLFASTTVSGFGVPSIVTTNTTAFTNVGTSTNVFGNTNSFVPSTTTTTFGSNVPSFGATNFGANQNSGFNSNLPNEMKNNSAFGTSSGSIFGVTTSPAFSSSGDFAQNTGFGSSFGATAASTVGNNVQVTPFPSAAPTFGSNNFAPVPPMSQSEVFTFGANGPSNTFNFTPENKSNMFGLGNKGLTSTPAFNPGPLPFTSPTGATGIFNIGTGGSSTPSRSRPQLKGKRRT